MVEVRPEGYTDGPDSDIPLNRRDMRSKFGCTALCEIAYEGNSNGQYTKHN